MERHGLASVDGKNVSVQLNGGNKLSSSVWWERRLFAYGEAGASCSAKNGALDTVRIGLCHNFRGLLQYFMLWWSIARVSVIDINTIAYGALAGPFADFLSRDAGMRVAGVLPQDYSRGNGCMQCTTPQGWC